MPTSPPEAKPVKVRTDGTRPTAVSAEEFISSFPALARALGDMAARVSDREPDSLALPTREGSR